MTEEPGEDGAFVHYGEGPGDHQVGNPLGGYGNGHSSLDAVGKNLRQQYPGYWTPAHGKGSGVSEHEDQRKNSHFIQVEGETQGKHAYPHGDTSKDHQRLTAKLVDRKNGNYGEGHVDNTHNDGLHQRGVISRSHASEYIPCIVENNVDTHKLLEDREQDPDYNNQSTKG